MLRRRARAVAKASVKEVEEVLDMAMHDAVRSEEGRQYRKVKWLLESAGRAADVRLFLYAALNLGYEAMQTKTPQV